MADLGFGLGALFAGFLADLAGMRAIGSIALLTAASGLVVLVRMREKRSMANER